MKSKSLKKNLNGIDVFSISAGAMISSGLFILPGLIYAKVGPAVILVYIIAGVFTIPVLLSKIELTTAMPKAGGSYFFIERSMGSIAGAIGGFASWFSLSFKSAFALLGIGEFAVLIIPDISQFQVKLIAAAFCLLFTIINLTSVKHTGKTQVFLVLMLVALLLLYIFSGLRMVEVERYTPFITTDRGMFFLAIGMVFISFGGLTKGSSVAEEVINPKRNIPLGMMSAFIAILFIYGLTIFVTVGLIDANALSNSLIPLSLGGGAIFGKPGVIIMAVAAILAFISTANAGILAASRFPVAMSRDQLLPTVFSKVSHKFQTPHFSIVFTGVFMILVIIFLDLENLVKVASSMKIVLFLFVLLAHIIMKESKILNYKPSFVAPLYPWLQVIGVVSYIFFIFQMGSVALLSVGGFLIISLIWYRFYIRGRVSRKSALIHIVERVTAKEIAGNSLGTELGEILRVRDVIKEDRFDAIVKECQIMDIKEEKSLKEFFDIISERLSSKLAISVKKLSESFILRESDISTVVCPGVAIPHIIIPGEGKLELMLVRCSAGINFIDDQPPVYAAFVLVGSADERDAHLHALSAIAQIIQNENFNREWLRAHSINELRDLVVFSERYRIES